MNDLLTNICIQRNHLLIESAKDLSAAQVPLQLGSPGSTELQCSINSGANLSVRNESRKKLILFRACINYVLLHISRRWAKRGDIQCLSVMFLTLISILTPFRCFNHIRVLARYFIVDTVLLTIPLLLTVFQGVKIIWRHFLQKQGKSN